MYYAYDTEREAPLFSDGSRARRVPLLLVGKSIAGAIVVLAATYAVAMAVVPSATLLRWLAKSFRELLTHNSLTVALVCV